MMLKEDEMEVNCCTKKWVATNLFTVRIQGYWVDWWPLSGRSNPTGNDECENGIQVHIQGGSTLCVAISWPEIMNNTIIMLQNFLEGVRVPKTRHKWSCNRRISGFIAKPVINSWRKVWLYCMDSTSVCRQTGPTKLALQLRRTIDQNPHFQNGTPNKPLRQTKHSDDTDCGSWPNYMIVVIVSSQI